MAKRRSSSRSTSARRSSSSSVSRSRSGGSVSRSGSSRTARSGASRSRSGSTRSSRGTRAGGLRPVEGGDEHDIQISVGKKRGQNQEMKMIIIGAVCVAVLVGGVAILLLSRPSDQSYESSGGGNYETSNSGNTGGYVTMGQQAEDKKHRAPTAPGGWNQVETGMTKEQVKSTMHGDANVSSDGNTWQYGNSTMFKLDGQTDQISPGAYVITFTDGKVTGKRPPVN